MNPIEVVTLTDGGQRPEDIAARLVAWLGTARESLDIALYDVRLPGPVGDDVAGAIRAARDAGVSVRIMFNQDEHEEEPRPFEPPPPRTDPSLLEQLGVPLKAIPGWRDLMHHKYVVRDGAAVWTGSSNWTLDNWSRAENVLVTVESPELAAAYSRDFEQMWKRGRVDERDGFDAPTVRVGDATVRPWFCPGRGPELSHRIAKRIGAARRRVRIASPVLTAGPILGTLNEVLAEGRVDVLGVCDATQVRQVFQQWAANQRSHWKTPLLQRALTVFHGKNSTPYAPGSLHDFMHAKVTVADDVTFVGSFNLSRSGETNAENVLEIADPALAERMAGYIDGLRSRYPAMAEQ
jgi:phosphatidylserine/phosphatidylglycerophosphate/cardiolipin synthase-like enzyme